jgi:hypothetical protein
VNTKLFAELVESMEQMNEIARGERAPSREFHASARGRLALPRPQEFEVRHVADGDSSRRNDE